MEQLAWERRCLAMRRLQISSSEAAAHGKRRWLAEAAERKWGDHPE